MDFRRRRLFARAFATVNHACGGEPAAMSVEAVRLGPLRSRSSRTWDSSENERMLLTPAELRRKQLLLHEEKSGCLSAFDSFAAATRSRWLAAHVLTRHSIGLPKSSSSHFEGLTAPSSSIQTNVDLFGCTSRRPYDQFISPSVRQFRGSCSSIAD